MIALTCGGSGGDDLSGAAAVYADAADLLARYETSIVRVLAAHAHA